MRRIIAEVIESEQGPMTLAMLRDALQDRGACRPGSSLAATLSWLVAAGVIERRGTRRSYVYEARERPSSGVRALEMAISGWRRRSGFGA